jgi:hypothetical protein
MPTQESKIMRYHDADELGSMVYHLRISLLEDNINNTKR